MALGTALFILPMRPHLCRLEGKDAEAHRTKMPQQLIEAATAAATLSPAMATAAAAAAAAGTVAVAEIEQLPRLALPSAAPGDREEHHVCEAGREALICGVRGGSFASPLFLWHRPSSRLRTPGSEFN